MHEKDSANNSSQGGLYAHYVLFVLVIVFVFNFIDRQILAILSQDIQADLGIGDAEMGFLYGTVFALFYAVFGIPLARFADVWVRRSLISGGLFFWSLMTALSGFAQSFSMLAGLRIGVGIGEASATPAAYSMLSDYYSPQVRATVLAIYSSGAYIGGGIGLFLGGFLLETWGAWFPNPINAPLGLKGWQAAFLAVGLPGVLMAIWVRTLKEPPRGISEGLVSEEHSAPLLVLRTELASMMPMLNLVALSRQGASLKANFIAAIVVTIVATILAIATDNTPQWLALGVGVYVSFSWAQSLKARDPVTYQMIFGSKAMLYTTIAFPTISFVVYGLGFWTPALLLRVHDTSPGEVGMYLGLGGASGGLIGITLGGIFADWAKRKHPAGRLVVGYLAILGTVPLVLWMIYTPSLTTAFILFFTHHLFSAAWPGIPPTIATELVLPRMRAVAGAYFILINTMVGLALGPYFMGQLSDFYAANGMDSAESLQTAMATSLLMFGVTLIFLTLAWRHLPRDEASRLNRARLLGEKV